MTKTTKLAVLKAGGKIIIPPPCANCGGTDFKLTDECEDGYLLVDCLKCGWSYGVGSTVTPCLQNYLIPLYNYQEAKRRELEVKIKEAKTEDERVKYKKLWGERIHLEGEEIHHAWGIIRKRFMGGQHEV